MMTPLMKKTTGWFANIGIGIRMGIVAVFTNPGSEKMKISEKIFPRTFYCEAYENWHDTQRAYLNINPDGSVNMCCWEIPSLILGNAITDKVGELYENAIKDEVIKSLLDMGPWEVGKKLGFRPEKKYMNLCSMCEEILKDYTI